MQPPQRDNRDVGAFPCFERPDQVVEVDRPRTRRCRQRQRIARRHCRRIAAHPFWQQSSQMNLGEHILVIVRGWSVGAQTHTQTGFDEASDGSDAAGKFQVR